MILRPIKEAEFSDISRAREADLGGISDNAHYVIFHFLNVIAFSRGYKTRHP